MILPIVKAPNAVLKTKAKKVLRFDDKLQKLLIDMSETLVATTDPEGVGLAANQVGVSKRIFIIRPNKKSEIREFINPEIIKFKKDKIKNKKELKDKTTLEGCLSLEKIWAPVYRPSSVLVAYQTKDGTHHEEWFTGFHSIIIQHEMDHLNGILFTLRALEQGAPVYEEVGEEYREIKLS
jgi:peptide deformylase